ncbi:MAG: polysaccharide biosynthesis/export family protein [Gammaproteobacteria bacterium]|nr:polysaccharide biosynthesis/export family protein [Gammaproteobacteria bacterium]
MNFLKIILLFIVSTILSACFPGMKMDKNIYDDGASDAILITPELVKKLNFNHNNNPIYKVGRQDVLMVKVWGDEDLSTIGGNKNSNQGADGLTVQNNGVIFYPYIGNVKVMGKSIEQIRILLTQKLSKYITNPQISVSVSEYHSKRVHIMGEVLKPKTYAITNTPMSLLDAILLGGINNTTADTQQIYVIRRLKKGKSTVYQFNGEYADRMLLAGQFYLKPNDVVFVAPAGVASWNRVISNILPSANFKATVDR